MRTLETTLFVPLVVTESGAIRIKGGFLPESEIIRLLLCMKEPRPSSSIPAFRLDGYLPEGVYVCSEAEVLFRFGSSSRRCRRLVLRLRRWIELGRKVGALQLLVDGSFVTAKEEPHDIDSVILLPTDFSQQLEWESTPALELEEMVLTRRPEELFAAEDETDWQEWVAFFSQTREADRRRKGLVEIRL